MLYFVTYFDWLKTVPALKGPKPALDFGKAGLEGLPRPGNTAHVVDWRHFGKTFFNDIQRFQLPSSSPSLTN